MSLGTPTAIAVRRLVREGAVNEAHQLIARQPHYDVGFLDTTVKTIRNLLMIYTETGDVSALSEVQQDLELAEAFQTTIDDLLILHEFAARRYVGARRHRDGARTTAAAADMAVNHMSSDPLIREQSLLLTIRMCLDHGDIASAGHYAEHLLHDEEIKPPENRPHPGPGAILHVAAAYIREGRLQEAMSFIRPLLADGSLHSFLALQAIELMASGGESPALPALHARHLDPILSISSEAH